MVTLTVFDIIRGIFNPDAFTIGFYVTGVTS